MLNFDTWQAVSYKIVLIVNGNVESEISIPAKAQILRYGFAFTGK